MQGGSFRQYLWTVKVDPDTVWFPDRLLYQLKQKNPNQPLVVRQDQNRNTPEKFLGPIEVFSRAAVQKYADAMNTCDSGLSKWGEDGWIHTCMRKLIGEPAIQPDYFLLYSCALNAAGCCNQGAFAAFHKFKSVPSWTACRNIAIR